MNVLKQFPYKNVLVLGLAKSGTVAAELLLNNDISVTITDKQAKESDEAVIKLKERGAHIVLGDHPLSLLEGLDLIVKNPGIPYSIPLLRAAEEQKIPIITEVELTSYLLDDEQIIGVTGTNGKTTTTTLIGEILQQANQSVEVAGNIGVVASERAMTLAEDERLLLELSSFQLMGTEKFHPHIAVILNIHEAHIDYHGTVEAYTNAKLQLLHNQTEADYFIYNMDDPVLCEAAKHAVGKLIPFSVEKKLAEGAWTDGEYLYYKQEQVVHIEDIVLVGKHNIANILAAISVAKLQGVDNESIQTVLGSFQGVEHRLQFVMNKNNRLFYNDSKATNILAAETALQSFTRPVIWIAGGLDRGDDVTELLPYLKYIKAMVVFGESAKKFAALAQLANINQVSQAESMEEAVQFAYQNSIENDVILLSPACASWDQYKTYEERGNMFIQAVHNLL